ncbi:hypothetical protein ACQP3J_31690, partial [Escherichia coli]
MFAHTRLTSLNILNPYLKVLAYMGQKCHIDSKKYLRREPSMIHVTYAKEQFDWLFQNNESWAIA